MELLIGGLAQGKRSYALQKHGLTDRDVCDGGVCPLDAPPAERVLDHLHLLTRRLLEAGRDPDAFLVRYLRARSDAVVISDEIGCGIVPMEGAERLWRERTGRLLCALAAKADSVERLCCGIPQTIRKGERPC